MSQYPGVGWVDGPNGGTPLDAANLEVMDQGIADEDLRNPASPASLAAAALYGHDVRAWAPNTPYIAGQAVVSPTTGDVVTAKTNHTSGATFSGTGSSGNWNLSATFVTAAGADSTIAGLVGAPSSSQTALDGRYVSPKGATHPGRVAPLTYYSVEDYGLKADNGVTDNSPLLSAMIAAVPDGSEIRFASNGTNYYGFASTVNVNKSLTFRGSWGRESSGAGVNGAYLRGISQAAFAPSKAILEVTVARCNFIGLALIGSTTNLTVTASAGSKVLTVTSGTVGSWMVNCPISGTGVPVFANHPTTITAVDTTAGTITISDNATAASSFTATVYSGYGIEFGSNSHLGRVIGCLITTYARGINLGSGADHISVHRSEVTGSYDNVVFGLGNLFDYTFIDSTLAGGPHASARLEGPNTSVENVSFIRTHLGFSPYGIVQDSTSSGDGFAGISMVASPIEQVTQQHICIVNGGNITVDSACYWVWSGQPATVPFQITGLQNAGPISFRAHLVATSPNPNAPYLFQVPNQNGFPADFHHVPLNGFASATYQFSSYTAGVFDGSVFFNGSLLSAGPTTTVQTFGHLKPLGTFEPHAVTANANYSTGASTDFWVRCTANSFTVTLTQTGNQQMVIVTNEGAGTITMAVSAGSYFGPATIAAGHGATFVSDGTNWRCIGAY